MIRLRLVARALHQPDNDSPSAFATHPWFRGSRLQLIVAAALATLWQGIATLFEGGLPKGGNFGLFIVRLLRTISASAARDANRTGTIWRASGA